MFCVWFLKPLDRIFHFMTWMRENEVIGDGGDQLTIETLKEMKKPFAKEISRLFINEPNISFLWHVNVHYWTYWIIWPRKLFPFFMCMARVLDCKWSPLSRATLLAGRSPAPQHSPYFLASALLPVILSFWVNGHFVNCIFSFVWCGQSCQWESVSSIF